ncbi:lasso peptide biosynthesis PqqD family chaperone [Cryptosporangium aurantiacum]|uniref:Coenzyme PQQ synthesis protein D (PqqD) n=1 Tax=Cryptosporangium aurantiacum TaxID=134849 RepID=A0A1M7RNL9_9ACTN|nr:lasso peptide biosynthesis PqqD family chaperone [Cryptosporangium aurantiacum]SHN47903.1 Coenzyme PQQ synthesis protein D (PqqD) [Cryptosporangium aurantiacum]
MSLTLADSVSLTPTDDGMVLLDERTGRYFQLNDTGATILLMLTSGVAEDLVAVELRKRFGVGADTADQDVVTFTAALRSAGLVTP